jgi:serine/threonine protein kinase
VTSIPRERPPAGLTVGGYRLLARLGEGGMGVVHLAQRPGGARVALKVMRPHIVGDDEGRARLAREVSSLSRIRSRRVAEIVDADPWGEVPYVATRYVPGLSLHDEVRGEGPITGPDLLWFASCLADALAAVHSVGVLHRDIKPSNVLMEGRTPVLIDFGLARVAEDPRLTHTGWLLGTPGYLAPEILYGDDATPASDVHSWAATVAFAGTGRPPFGRGPSVAVMDRVRRGEHDLSGLEPALLGVVTEALHPDPLHRPTLDELGEWFDSRLDGTPDEHEDHAEHTVPFAVASLATVDDPTEQDAVWPTRSLTEVRHERRPDEDLDRFFPADLDEDLDEEPLLPWESAGPVRPRTGALERLRRATLVIGGAATAAAGITLAPYVALAAIAVLVWLLRSASLAGSAASNRRLLRGARWYDAPQVLVATPWHLVAGIPGTLLLVLWSAGIGAAAALLCFAAGLGFTASLGVVAFAFAVSVWLGPGGNRVRSPLNRVVRPLARRPVAWFVATAVLLALAGGLASVASSSGTSWTPDDDRPLSDVDVPGGGILSR